MTRENPKLYDSKGGHVLCESIMDTTTDKILKKSTGCGAISIHHISIGYDQRVMGSATAERILSEAKNLIENSDYSIL